jgi:hypothetical protein
MNPTTFSFLKAVLGNDGAQALKKAIARDPRLEHYLVPRTLMGWLASRPQYEGHVPGVREVYLSFAKSEAGFEGSIGIGNQPVNKASRKGLSSTVRRERLLARPFFTNCCR